MEKSSNRKKKRATSSQIILIMRISLKTPFFRLIRSIIGKKHILIAHLSPPQTTLYGRFPKPTLKQRYIKLSFN